MGEEKCFFFCFANARRAVKKQGENNKGDPIFEIFLSIAGIKLPMGRQGKEGRQEKFRVSEILEQISFSEKIETG